MPIQLKCPNGHHLTAKESNAGKTGKCPVCKAAVKIPVLHQTVMTDSAIVRIMGDPDKPLKPKVGATVAPPNKKSDIPRPPKPPKPNSGDDAPSHSSISLPHVKLCPSCEREIDMGYHICPHCHTYITGLNDF